MVQNSSVLTRRGRAWRAGGAALKTLPFLPGASARHPGWGDGEADSVRGEEAAQRLPGVPDVLHWLVPTAQG